MLERSAAPEFVFGKGSAPISVLGLRPQAFRWIVQFLLGWCPGWEIERPETASTGRERET